MYFPKKTSMMQILTFMTTSIKTQKIHHPLIQEKSPNHQFKYIFIVHLEDTYSRDIWGS